MSTPYLDKKHLRKTTLRYLDTLWLDYFQFFYILSVQCIQEYSGNYTFVVLENIVICPNGQRQDLTVRDSGPLRRKNMAIMNG